MPVSPLLPSRLSTLQSFKELVWGTSAAATAKWMGVVPRPTFKPYTKAETFDEQRGSFAPGYNAAILKKGGEFTINSHASFEDMNFFLAGAVNGAPSITGSTPINIVSSTNASPIEITVAAHSLNTGDWVYITDHLINTAANGGWQITKISGTKFTLNGSTGNGIGGASGTVGIAPFTQVFASPLVSAWNPQSYTLEWGYDLGAIKASGCLFNKMTIKGEASKNWEITSGGFYKVHDSNATLTPALADRTIQTILTPITALALDVAGATPGITAFANTMLGFTYEVDTAIKPIYTASSLEPSSFVYEKYMASLTLDILYTAAVKAYMAANWLAGLPGIVQLKNTSGAKSAQLDFSGVLSDDPTLYGDKDGAQVISIKLSGLVDSVLGTYSKITTVNSYAGLP